MRMFFFISSIILLSCASKNEKTTSELTNFCENIHRNNSVSLSKSLKGLGDLMKTKTGVVVLENGGASMVTRAWLTNYAEQTIDIQYFIFSTDNVGLIACDFLVRAADRGVKVRIIVDDIMVNADIEDVLLLDSHANIDIKIYNPGVNLGKSILSKVKKFTTDFRSANQRMHNKTFIVDGKVVITGGRNIADEYFDYDHEYNFRDRDVLLLGKATKKVSASFETFWSNPLSVPIIDLDAEYETLLEDKHKFDRLHEYACNPANYWPQIRSKIENLHTTFEAIKIAGDLTWVDSLEFISDKPGKNDGSQGLGGGGLTTSALIKLVKNANSTIDIQSPLFNHFRIESKPFPPSG